MRIVIDMQGAQTESSYRGIGRYTLSLVKEMVINAGSHEIFLVLNGNFPETVRSLKTEFSKILREDRLHVWKCPIPIKEIDPENTRRKKAAEYLREAFIETLEPDVVLICSMFEGYMDDSAVSIGKFSGGAKTALIIHDLIPLIHPEKYLTHNPQYAKFYYSKFEEIKSADLLLAISKSTMTEIRETLKTDDDKVKVISAAVDEKFQPLIFDEQGKNYLLGKHNLIKDYILSPGAGDARKNLDRLLHSYSLLPGYLKNRHQLVLAGFIAEDEVNRLKGIAKKLGIKNSQLVFTGYIDEEDIVSLYNLCRVMIFPSLHEGFGFPMLEAMACGAASIGSNSTSIPELCENQESLFDPCSVLEIRNLLKKTLEDETYRENLIEYGLKRAKEFSWEKCARLALRALEDLGERENGKANKEEIKKHLIKEICNITSYATPQQELRNLSIYIHKILPRRCKRKIFVDISELIKKDVKTGIQRVTRAVISELIENPPDNFTVEAVYASETVPRYRHASGFLERLRGKSENAEDFVIEYNRGDIFLGLDLQPEVVNAQKNELKEMQAFGVKIYFVVYDLLPTLMPEYFPEGAKDWQATWLRNISNFDGAICISRAVSEELRNWLHHDGFSRLNEFKISWFHLGANIEKSVPSKGLPEGYLNIISELKKRKTFLMVGTIEPRKGYDQVFKAFDALWSRKCDVNLVLVGKQGWNVEELFEKINNHPENGIRLFVIETASDEYLNLLYTEAECLIAASEGEGFGLPLIEAARHGIGLIARDIPVFREVAGQNAYYFKGKSADVLAVAIQDWLKLRLEKKEPNSSGMKWIDWKESARKLANCILE